MNEWVNIYDWSRNKRKEIQRQSKDNTKIWKKYKSIFIYLRLNKKIHIYIRIYGWGLIW